MPQKIAAFIIVALAVLFVIRKLYRTVKNPEKEFSCSSDKCAGCSMKTDDCKPEKS